MITRKQAIGCLRLAVDLSGDGGCNPWTHEEEVSMGEYLDYLESHM